MIQVKYLELKLRYVGGEPTTDVLEEVMEFQDKDMASVMFNNKVDELCPVYMVVHGEKPLYVDKYNLLPLCQYIQGKRSIPELIEWRKNFNKPVSMAVDTALRQLDVAIANYSPIQGPVATQVHSYGLPEKTPQKQNHKVYSNYLVQYTYKGVLKPKIFDSHSEAVAAYQKIVSMNVPTTVYGLEGNKWILLCEHK